MQPVRSRGVGLIAEAQRRASYKWGSRGRGPVAGARRGTARALVVGLVYVVRSTVDQMGELGSYRI